MNWCWRFTFSFINVSVFLIVFVKIQLTNDSFKSECKSNSSRYLHSTIIPEIDFYEARWADVHVCLCAGVSSQMTTKQNIEPQKSKDLQARHGLSADTSHAGALNIIASLQRACLRLGACIFAPCLWECLSLILIKGYNLFFLPPLPQQPQ